MVAEGGERAGRFESPADELGVRPLVAPGLLLGLRLGGFFDGTVLHQIHQWHHLLTSDGSFPASTVVGLRTNTLWDGLFHASTFVFTTLGLVFLSAALSDGVPWSRRSPLGLVPAG